MERRGRARLTLMPLVALSSLSLTLTIPVLFTATIHAASPLHYATLIIKRGDNVWSLAESRTPVGSDVQAVVDTIVALNHLDTAGIKPGQRIRVPK